MKGVIIKELEMKAGENIKNAIYTFILSTIIFYVTVPECKIYLILFATIWLWILLGYGNRKNREFLSKLICFTIGNTIAFGIMKVLAGGSIKGMSNDKVEPIDIYVEDKLAESIVRNVARELGIIGNVNVVK